MAHIDRKNDLITVATEWTEKELIKSVPGSRWDANEKIWTVPCTWAACLQLRGIFGSNLTIGKALMDWSWNEANTRVIPASTLRNSIDRVHGFDDRLYDFQTAGSTFMLTSAGGLLGDDMGMGKTAQMLAVINAHAQVSVDNAFPALVICPNSVKTGWEKQIRLWNIDATPYVITGSALARRKLMESAIKDPRAIVIINIEAVRQFSRLSGYGSIALKRCRQCDKKFGHEDITPAKCEVHQKELNRFSFRTVILDEAHRIKEPSSKQTRACWAVAHGASVRHRYAMTGTPIANHVGDLWSIMHFIAPHEYPTKSKFVDRYALTAWNAFGGMDIVGVKPETREEFYKILDARFRRTPKALVLSQLPRVVRAVRWSGMSTKQSHAYTELEKRLVTRLDTGTVVLSPDHLVNATRLLQLSSSYFHAEWAPDPQPENPEHERLIVTLTEPSPKLDAMEEAYDELGGKPVVIVAQSRQLIDLAAKRFAARKIPYGLITGAVGEYERQMVIQRFQQNQINVVLMTIAAGGTGLDGLQHADTMFCLQRSWSMINNTQVDGRIDRIGSERHSSITIVDFVTRGTVEETRLFPKLMEKWHRLDEINRDRERLSREGITPDALYHLDQMETQIMRSNILTNGFESIIDDDDNEE